jgi:RNA polymerase sigma factor (sigma-70 family)
VAKALEGRNATVNDQVEMEDSASGIAWEWTKEEQLVEQARAGDREAFSELVRRHRAKAFGWASAISRDTAIAEDIVQEALISAFLHIGKLSEITRFQSWFHRIVQNQAYRRLRRGGPYGRERPFTSIEETSAGGFSSWNNTDWCDIDSIHFHFSESLKARHSDEDPETRIVRYELVESIRSLMKCLTKNERNVFEAHFFRQLPPAEIAVLFDTSTSNVYTLLSRSRDKVQKERIQVYFRDVAKQMAQDGKITKRILARPFDF